MRRETEKSDFGNFTKDLTDEHGSILIHSPVF